ncbi:Protein of unknown function [Roseivivax halotolerans]|jgi:hypothetical protein|uniref:Beta-barrel assembly machine subunit BamF n=1 Tax=Roseivivax halotolerans TaxID=93684 RepID=A0A1I5Z0C0_9RHOB|nr:DUF3035 domain-containing protein [Roseivivax halotolerans]SFQ49869.1 Protein of unknown function [Roseivivax halotolerans]
MRRAQFAMLISVLALGACGDGTLRTFGSDDRSPEEFDIVPNQPLETPVNFAELPAPTPGGANRADQQPLGAAVAALGGNPAALSATGVPSSDAALVNAASRFGRSAGIRTTLAEEDAEFRRRKSLFNWRLVPDNEYNRAYRSQSLDAYTWLRNVRQPGSNVATPSAPPQER